MVPATIQAMKISEDLQMSKSPQFETISKSISDFTENLTAATVNKFLTGILKLSLFTALFDQCTYRGKSNIAGAKINILLVAALTG